MKILSYRRFALFWLLAAQWFERHFIAISKQATIQQGLLNGISTSVSNITDYATESNATTNKDAIIAAILANAGTPTLTIPNSTLEQTLAPNTLYVFTDRTNNLTLTLGEPLVGKVSEYHCFIIAGETAPTVTYPDGITWNGGDAPTIAAGKIYEISILGNVAAFFEVEPATQS